MPCAGLQAAGDGMTSRIGVPTARLQLTASTLGAPGQDLDQVVTLLAAAGISGVELRLSLGEIASPAMTSRQREAVRTRLAEAGIRLTGLASYVRIADPDAGDDMVVGALAAALTLAAELGAPSVRVFPGAPTLPAAYHDLPVTASPRNQCDAAAVRRLNAVAGLSNDLGVHPVLETHDSHPRGADIAPILAQVKGTVGAVWDLMHPWRVGEPLETTWGAISPWLLNGLGSVQIKDARLPESRTPVPVGAGSLPVRDFAALLQRSSYDGTVCLEWEKAWHPEALPLEAGLASMKRWYQDNWHHETPPRGNRRHEQPTMPEIQ